ncbi:Bug family tripartite tricarboxylate transporter substrate binding protein [Neoroseomonas oryzicola]|uniref:Twin-arginine translocation pathway signal protein n=1 Tax=Neoroseomonas oryzicola TaxID=535904 RepID=A0A9X9WNI5_9PROT|nr:tripartite tricarboxylate transporter substrate-binding protein [Neoroseomonas oryzicola]MBR0661895.1 twin-arginine translocation pathway signal protein [Neoroseomonas oryzicola]NKE17060.1 twin-arginine translocation pathway signal protein [Neoroseomonas oryzicola]
MDRITRRAALLGTLAAPGLARAQGGWPDRPVRFVVPYSAGGVADTIARTLQARVAEHLGQSFVIDNRTGASGAIGAAAVAQSPADGYTLLFEGATFATLPEVRRDLPFDYAAAFVPVVQVTTQPYIIGIRAGFPATDLAGFVAEAKRRPGEVTYGTPGVAHIGHFMGEALQLAAGIRLEHVPFRGGADVARELAAGRIDAGIISYSSLRPAVERGATLIASTAGRRQASLPQIPVIAETFPGYDMSSWTGVFAPAGTPAAAMQRFGAAISAALADADVRRRLEAAGADPVESNPAAFAEVIRKDRETARRIVQATGLRVG